MNNRDEENIRNLITPLASMSMTNEKAWLLMQAKVKKMNFLSFGWYHINIYYVAVVGIITFSGAGLALSSMSEPNSTTGISKENVPVIENQISSDIKQYRTDDSIIFVEEASSETNMTEIVSKLSLPSTRLKSSQDISIDKPNSLNTLSTQVETVISEDAVGHSTEQITESVTENITKKPIQSRKSIIIEETYDTIVKVDTQYVERRRLFGRD